MDQPVTILHIDQDYQVSYWILRGKAKIVSSVSLKQAIDLLKTNEFDLIFSEPQNLAILKPSPEKTDPVMRESHLN
ncbi:MAG: hypothetical protein HY879_16320 [Deltaproteobacteria bacterium]|nr:hypothetical protein [Deltaproteobacteria bacterium]